MQDEYFKQQWGTLLLALEPRFGGDLDMQGILLLSDCKSLVMVSKNTVKMKNEYNARCYLQFT